MDINEIKKRLRAFLVSSNSKELKDKIGEYAIKLIRDRTRARKKDMDGKPIDGLEKETIDYRKRYRAFLHPATKPATSNLTMTGQMLDSITYKFKKNIITVFVPNTKRRPLAPFFNGKTTTNKIVAENVQVRRAFLGLSSEDNDKINKLFQRELRLLTRKYLGGN